MRRMMASDNRRFLVLSGMRELLGDGTADGRPDPEKVTKALNFRRIPSNGRVVLALTLHRQAGKNPAFRQASRFGARLPPQR